MRAPAARHAAAQDMSHGLVIDVQFCLEHVDELLAGAGRRRLSDASAVRTPLRSARTSPAASPQCGA